MKCEAKTSKKAWANPLAPTARCSREATAKVQMKGEPRMRDLCGAHAKQFVNKGGRSLSLVKVCCGSLFYACGCKR